MKNINRFAETHWEKADLEEALDWLELPVTEENITELANNVREDRLVDAMVEAGWEYLEDIAWQTFHERIEQEEQA